MIRTIELVVLCALCATVTTAPAGPHLANELAAEGSHAAAALEYRRQAVEAPAPAAQATYYWMAAYEYLQARDPGIAVRLLDRADELTDALATPGALLRAEAALNQRQYDVATFHLQSAQTGSTNRDARAFAAIRLAETRLRAGDAAGAGRALDTTVPDVAARREALQHYQANRDKRPWLGGVLGLVPGLGHAYSGEYANALRALILNGLFIFGMVDTAQDEQWGAFAAISFFELTWYSGSVYGGIDAAHRFNRTRLDECASDLRGQAGMAPDPAVLPVLSLRYSF